MGKIYELIEVGNDVPESADFGIRVSGGSMTPRFQDRQSYGSKRLKSFMMAKLESSILMEMLILRSSKAMQTVLSSFPLTLLTLLSKSKQTAALQLSAESWVKYRLLDNSSCILMTYGIWHMARPAIS